MNLNVTLPDEVIEEIAARAAAIVLAELGEHAGQEPSEFMGVGEAASFLRTDRQRIYDLCSAGELTRYKDGARVLLSRAELVARVTGRVTGAALGGSGNGRNHRRSREAVRS